MDKILNNLMNKYELNSEEKEEFYNYIKDIYLHPFFQERLKPTFPHHAKITLGEHILEDSIVTYILSKKYEKYPHYNKKLAIIISMFHDLYIEPWQNNIKGKLNKFPNKHGFRHPIEAIIAAITHYPQYFNNLDDAKIIIDGVIHHMYPFPVRRLEIGHENILELNNYPDLLNINKELLDIIIESSNRHSFRYYSFTKSLYLEGRTMSKADKIVSRLNLKGSSLSSKTALITGINKNIAK